MNPAKREYGSDGVTDCQLCFGLKGVAMKRTITGD